MVKKYGTVTCQTCGKKIRYPVSPKYIIRNGVDPNRLVYIRKHYSKHHPRKWKQAIRRGIRKRLERMRRLK